MGVTVTVEVTGSAVLFVPEKEGVFPIPLAARPIVAIEFVQEKVAPGVVLVKFEVDIVTPLQTVISGGTAAIGVGLTVMV